MAYYLVAGGDGLTSATIVREDRAQAEVFRPTLEDWSTTLERLGNRYESRTAGEAMAAVTREP